MGRDWKRRKRKERNEKGVERKRRVEKLEANPCGDYFSYAFTSNSQQR